MSVYHNWSGRKSVSSVLMVRSLAEGSTLPGLAVEASGVAGGWAGRVRWGQRWWAMRYGVDICILGEYADPARVVQLARAAEAAG